MLPSLIVELLTEYWCKWVNSRTCWLSFNFSQGRNAPFYYNFLESLFCKLCVNHLLRVHNFAIPIFWWNMWHIFLEHVGIYFCEVYVSKNLILIKWNPSRCKKGKDLNRKPANFVTFMNFTSNAKKIQQKWLIKVNET